MEQVGDRIAAVRKARGMTQEDLAKRIGISRPNLCRYETGAIKEIPEKMIIALSRALQVSPSYLRDYAADNSSEEEDIANIPLLGSVAAGFDRGFDVEDDETLPIPRSYLRGRPQEDFFILRVSGNSMWPDYQDGDIVLVLKQATLNRSGDVGVIRYKSDQATLKKVEFVHGEDWLLLIPLNSNGYHAEMVAGPDLEECSVLGIPRMVIREIS